MFRSSVVSLFREKETPFYYYDMELLGKTLEAAAIAAAAYGFHIHYALKANFNSRILQRIREAGFGADCVSRNEVKTAVQAGFPNEKIVFAGVGKADKEILTALEHDIMSFNVESVQELKVIASLAAATDTIARVALRINPNV